MHVCRITGASAGVRGVVRGQRVEKHPAEDVNEFWIALQLCLNSGARPSERATDAVGSVGIRFPQRLRGALCAEPCLVESSHENGHPHGTGDCPRRAARIKEVARCWFRMKWSTVPGVV